MRNALYAAAQWLWGFPQTLAGLCTFLFVRGGSFRFHGAVVKRWRLRGSVSLGMFLFVSESLQEERQRAVLVHEYGHSVQSLILGPFYLFAVGLPSVLWAGLPAMEKRRRERGISYYSRYPENWANALGERFTGERAER